MAEQKREPLTWWGTVGANIAGGFITGAIGATITLVVAAFAARSVSESVLEGMRKEGAIPPKAGGEEG